MIAVVPFAPHAAPPAVHGSVRDLLLEVDAEFVPPLSQRADTLQLHSPTSVLEQGPGRYLDAAQGESWLVAIHGDRVLGLLTFLEAPKDPWLTGWSPSLYATTVAVLARARRMGICGRLYDAFEATARQRAVPYLTTRTWTTNTAHLCFLRDREFHTIAQLPDDRYAGVGTVYLGYRVRRCFRAS